MKKILKAIAALFDAGAEACFISERRRIELDALRLGGRVVWEDIQ